MPAQTKSAPPLILTFNGRSASCTIHVLMINGTSICSPEFMVREFSFLRDWGKSDTSDTVRRVCMEAQKKAKAIMDNYGLWSHGTQEWTYPYSPTDADHTKCACSRQSNRALFHAHTLLVDRRVFRNFTENSLASATKPLILVATRQYESAVRNYFKRAEKKLWKSKYLYSVYIAYSQQISHQNMVALSKKFDLIELGLEKLHLDFALELGAALKSLGFDPQKSIENVDKLFLQRITWQGGVSNPLFAPAKLMGHDYQNTNKGLENLILTFDPTSDDFNSAKRRTLRITYLVLADLIAVLLVPWFLFLRQEDSQFQTWIKDHHTPVVFGKSRAGIVGKALNLLWGIPIAPYLIIRLIGRFSFAKTRRLLVKI